MAAVVAAVVGLLALVVQAAVVLARQEATPEQPVQPIQEAAVVVLVQRSVRAQAATAAAVSS
jgi:hypothetical protein